MFTDLLIGALKKMGVAKMSRVQVFKKLQHERLYQQSRWDLNQGHSTIETRLRDDIEPVVERFHELGAWISFMETYLEKARDINSTSDDKEEPLLFIRKVTAMGVACLEQHGCPDRTVDPPEGGSKITKEQFVFKQLRCFNPNCPVCSK